MAIPSNKKIPQKLTITKEGVFLDGALIPGVVSAEIKNINPGPMLMEVALHFMVSEIDVQYGMRDCARIRRD